MAAFPPPSRAPDDIEKWLKAPDPTVFCRHCDRPIVVADGRWIDLEATGDDVMWRETCDAHDTFAAEHEPRT